MAIVASLLHVIAPSPASATEGRAVNLVPATDAAAVDIDYTPSESGYWVTYEDGTVVPHAAESFGDRPSLAPGERITALTPTHSGGGYWLFSSLGRVYPHGDAEHFGDMAGVNLNGPVIDAIATNSGLGYWMVAEDGGIFSFGDAQFYGSMGGVTLNGRVVGLAPTPEDDGYWLVAEDGGIFAFGTAGFFGSMGGTVLNQPVIGMLPQDDGYMMVARDGGIFNFGNSPFHGSLGGQVLSSPIVSGTVRSDRSGYLMIDEAGATFDFGTSMGLAPGALDESVTLVDGRDLTTPQSSDHGEDLRYSGPRELEVGDVVVAPPTDGSPSGFMGKVTQVIDRDGVQELVAEPVAAAEIVPEYEGSGTIPVGEGTEVQAAGLRSLSAKAIAEIRRRCPSAKVSVLDLEVGVGVENANVGWGFSWGPGRHDHASVVVEWDATLDADLDFGVDGTCEVDLAGELPEVSILRGVIPGTPIPWSVDLEPAVELSFGASANALSASTQQRIRFRLGFTYTDGDASVIREADHESTTHVGAEPGLSGFAEVFVGMGLEVEFGGSVAFGPIRGTAEAEIEFLIGGALTFEISVPEDPWWELALELRAEVGFEFELEATLFGRGIDQEIEIDVGTLRLFRKRLASANGPYEGPQIGATSVRTIEGFAGRDVLRVLNGAGGTAPLVWSASGLPPGVEMSSEGTVSGIPQDAGSWGAVVVVEDAAGYRDTATLRFEIRIDETAVAHLRDRVVRRASDGTSWYVDDDLVAHHIPDGGVFLCLTAWKDKRSTDATAAQLRQLPVGSPQTCVVTEVRDHVIRTSDSRSWYVDDQSRRHPITDGGVFLCLTEWRDKRLTQVSAEQAAALPVSGSPAECSVGISDEILRVPSGESWYIDSQGFRRPIPDGGVFLCLSAWEAIPVRNVTERQADALPVGRAMTCQPAAAYDRVLTNPAGNSWYVDRNGTRHHIEDGGTYECFVNYQQKEALTVTQDHIDALPAGANATCWVPPRSTVVRRSSDGASWYVDGSLVAHPIPDGGVYLCMTAWRGVRVVSISPAQAVDLKVGSPQACVVEEVRDRVIETPQGASWYVGSDSVRHPIPDGGVYLCLTEWRGKQVRRVSELQATALPTGPTQSCTIPEAHDRILRTEAGNSWFVDGGGVAHHIPDGGTYECLRQYLGKQVLTVTDRQVQAFPRGVDQSCWVPARDTVVRRADGASWYIDGDLVAHPIPNGGTFNCLVHWKGKRVVQIGSNEARDLKIGNNQSCVVTEARDRVIRLSNGTSWYVDGNSIKHPIPNGGTYNCLVHWKGKRVLAVSSSQASALATGSNQGCTVTEARNTVIRRPSDGRAWYVDGNSVRHWIPNGGTYNCLVRVRGVRLIDGVSTEQAEALPLGRNQTCQAMLRGPDGTSFYINSSDERFWVPDGGTFECIEARGVPVYRYSTWTVIDLFVDRSNWARCP